MKKLILIIAVLATGIVNSQTTKEDFKNTFPEVKELTVMSNNLEMGYEDQYISDSELVAYKVNGIYIVYDNAKWFIPYKRIESIGSTGKMGLQINLKS